MERHPDRVMVTCDECKQLVDLAWTVHICTIWSAEGHRVKTTKKLWNPTLRLWELHPDEIKKTFPQEERELGWQKLEKVAGDEKEKGEEKKEATFQSCKIPERKPLITHHKSCICRECRPSDLRHHIENCRCYDCWKWKWEIGAVFETWASYSRDRVHGYYGYYHVRPWSGLSREKWPNTFDFCLSQYFIGNRWYEGLTIPDKDYEDRVCRGIYAPEPKRYKPYDDWRKAEQEKDEEERKRKASETYKEGEDKTAVELVKEEDDETTFWMKWSSYGEA